LDNISTNRDTTEEEKEECQHMETYLIPMEMGYVKQCVQCGENIVRKQFTEE
jgi:predicted RNA-binding Zn-ribbon protein involved in translation (DUF1610 family)